MTRTRMHGRRRPPTPPFGSLLRARPPPRPLPSPLPGPLPHALAPTRSGPPLRGRCVRNLLPGPSGPARVGNHTTQTVLDSRTIAPVWPRGGLPLPSLKSHALRDSLAALARKQHSSQAARPSVKASPFRRSCGGGGESPSWRVHRLHHRRLAIAVPDGFYFRVSCNQEKVRNSRALY